VLHSFIFHEEGDRRVNILGYKYVEEMSRVVSFSNLIEKDRERVDLRTSVWLMGKLLKFFVLAQDLGLTVETVNTFNLLFEPGQHYVMLFDFTEAELSPDESVPPEKSLVEISRAAQAVVDLAGGNFLTRVFPDDEAGRLKPYTDFLCRLALGGQENALRAHAECYEIADQLWPKEKVEGSWRRVFHPFTTYPR
jgi:hypothetical protein